VTLNAQANTLSTQMERPHIYLGVYATAIDGGAAVGPLLAYSIGTLTGFGALYLAAGGVLALGIFRYCWPGRMKVS
jgi:hypothetical protein